MKRIVSAISLWKKYNLKNPLGASEWAIEEENGKRYCHVSYSGHAAEDGSVRIYARFVRPVGEGKKPTVLLLADAGKPADEDTIAYFTDRGYAVLMPDYSGKIKEDGEGVLRTVYPPSLAYGNYEQAQGLFSMQDMEADKTTWFEWTYVALYSVEYLKSREDVGRIGVVGIGKGGEIAWHTMLSPDVKCGIPVNAAGWHSFLRIAKFGDNIAHNLSDEQHCYIASAEAQSYAPYVKCPVLMLCALRDAQFDCDRAYDTYSRIGNTDGNALVYSLDTGACIGPNALRDMDLFLEKNLKGREIYIPDTLNVRLEERADGVEIFVECDKEGLLEEAGIYYAEADVKTRSTYRDWRCIHRVDGRSVKDGKLCYKVQPFAGAKAVFVYAYAKYINGFRVTSKITAKRLSVFNPSAIRSRKIYAGGDVECFGIADHEEYSIGGIFLEKEGVPKISVGYGGIKGAYSVGGIKTYKISSPEFIPMENAFLEFDVYGKADQEIEVSVEVANFETGDERYICAVPLRGGGKWKRIILKPADFKAPTGKPLENFYLGSALMFKGNGKEFSITNILWL